MPRQNTVLARFNNGLISPRALARTDIERVGLSAETMNNWVTRSFGNMMLRPGLGYIGATASNAAARYIPFIFSQSDTALLEFTDSAMRVWISDALMTRTSVSTAITNGTFDTALTGWTNDDDAGATSAWYIGGYMSLIGDGTNYAREYQKVTVATADRNVEHAIRVVVERGPIFINVGSGKDTDNFVSQTELVKGEHSLSFTPDNDFYITVKSRDKYNKLLNSIAIESSGAVSITSPYAAADLDNIRYRQSADVVYLACDGYQPYKIERRTSTSWSLVRYYPEKGPFRAINISDTTITPSGTSGNISLTASSPIFETTHKESLWRLVSPGQTETASIAAANTFTSAIEVNGTGNTRIFTVDISGTFSATVTLQRSLDSSTGPWTDVHTWTATTTAESYDDGLDNFQAWYRIGVKTGDYTSGTATTTLTYSSGAVEGIVRLITDEYGWAVQSASETNQWRDVAWAPSLNLFAAVSSDGTNRVMTSPDGVTWTARSAAAANSWISICWSPANTLFCAISSSGTNRVMTSPDGTTWTSRTESESNSWTDICWSPANGLFCAVALNGTHRVMTSPDGITWTNRTAAEANQWQAITWSEDLGLFVAVAVSGTNRVMTSPDGITWTARAAAAANQWYDVCWSSELSLFVAVAISATSDHVMYSSDGTTWTAAQAPSNYSWSCVEWSPELGIFTSLAITSTGTSMTSPDGINWTSHYLPAQGQWRNIAWAPELSLYCAVSYSGTYRVMISTTDGKNVLAEVIEELGNTDATKNWYEGQWSDYRGWPTSVGLIEGRVAFAGRNKFNASVSDDYQNFDDTTVGDSGPLQRTIGSGPVDTINWILEIQRAILGGQAEEYICKSSTQDEILTPTTLTIRPTSTKGSNNVQAVKVDHTGVFAQKNGTRLIRIAIGQSGEYESVDISGITPETFAAGIKRIAVQYLPDVRVITVLNDGTVVVGQHDAIENVFGFYTWSSTGASGLIEDVVVLPGSDATDEDSVYFVVNRTVNSATVRYLEKMALESECVGGTQNKQLDSFITYSGASTATLTGLSHLEGETVYVWGDGIYQGTATVASGSITIGTAVSSAVIGLTYTAQWKSTKLAYASGLGTALLQKKNISHLGIIAKDIHPTGLQYGPDFSNLYPMPAVEEGATINTDTMRSTYDEPAFEFEGTWNTDSRLCLQAQGPKPANILAAIISIETHDKY